MAKWIGEITEQVPVIGRGHTSNDADQLFRQYSSCEGIIVTEDDSPLALISKTSFYQKLGTLYGYQLFMKRPVELIMNTDILTVDYMTSIVEVSKLAMNRKKEQLYDYVIVTNSGLYAGVVSIRNLLITFAEIQAKAASYLNPLTGLPGNHLIEQRLEEIIQQRFFTVLYIDLDNFKTYNDVYGFSMGDQVILATSALLQSVITDFPSAFLGHIGGDDFIMVLTDHNYQSICKEIITEFDIQIKQCYKIEHLKLNHVISENRSGVKEKIPLVSISISVVTNQYTVFTTKEQIIKKATTIKKACKLNHYSCFLTDRPTDDLLNN